MKIAGIRDDDALFLDYGVTCQILKGDRISAPLDRDVADQLGPWTEIEKSLASRRAVEDRALHARYAPLGFFVLGGAGSGNFGHSGRPGERGGSGEGNGGATDAREKNTPRGVRALPPGQVARAAGTDVANRSMRAAGRTTWNADDYNAAAAEHNRVADALAPEAKTGGLRAPPPVVSDTPTRDLAAEDRALNQAARAAKKDRDIADRDAARAAIGIGERRPPTDTLRARAIAHDAAAELKKARADAAGIAKRQSGLKSLLRGAVTAARAKRADEAGDKAEAKERARLTREPRRPMRLETAGKIQVESGQGPGGRFTTAQKEKNYAIMHGTKAAEKKFGKKLSNDPATWPRPTAAEIDAKILELRAIDAAAAEPSSKVNALFGGKAAPPFTKKALSDEPDDDATPTKAIAIGKLASTKQPMKKAVLVVKPTQAPKAIVTKPIQKPVVEKEKPKEKATVTKAVVTKPAPPQKVVQKPAQQGWQGWQQEERGALPQPAPQQGWGDWEQEEHVPLPTEKDDERRLPERQAVRR